MTFCLHELSLNQEIQDKARKNVQEVLARHDGKINYESLSEMVYLEQCINGEFYSRFELFILDIFHFILLSKIFFCVQESLRKFPPGASLIRTVTKDYQVPESNVVLKKGMTMITSIYAIHHDPEIYPDPEVFDPERFTHDKMVKRHPMAFIPFGEFYRRLE